ncbi:Anaphase-promoting complex subunit 13 [Tyrophagus putrescentiae]|nr:Anaphase-promoting complex subunit 13 [Tyrophagus putrescentiae]
MDSELTSTGRSAFLVDRSWREDVSSLPDEDIYVPANYLPDPEPDNGNPTETLKEIDLKWTDLALGRLSADAAGTTGSTGAGGAN